MRGSDAGGPRSGTASGGWPFGYVRHLLISADRTPGPASGDGPFRPEIIGPESIGAVVVPVPLSARAWVRQQPTSPDAVVVEGYGLAPGDEDKVEFSSTGSVWRVTLTKANFERALAWGKPGDREFTDFERELMTGSADGRRFGTVGLLIDVENGTVGYDVRWPGEGRTKFTRRGEVVSNDVGPGLEQPDLIPELVLSLGTDAVRGVVMRGVRALAREIVERSAARAAARVETTAVRVFTEAAVVAPAAAPKIAMGEIKSVSSYVAALRQLAQRAHPLQGNTALAIYDETGAVWLQVFREATDGVRRIVWEGAIGSATRPAARYGTAGFGNAIEAEIIDMVGRASGQRFPAKAANAAGPDLLIAPEL